MQIIIDYDHPPGSPIEGRHLIMTGPGEQPQITLPALGVNPVDVIHFVAGLHSGLIPIAGTGWDVISKHPSYPGQTRLQVFLGEIVRLNDAPSRAILGV